MRVHTSRDWLVLASDASHFYDNLLGRSPFPIVYNVGDMVEGYRTIEKLADSPDHIIPGHDPRVREKFSPVREDLSDFLRLDSSPR